MAYKLKRTSRFVFVDEHGLKLTNKEYEKAKGRYPKYKKNGR